LKVAILNSAQDRFCGGAEERGQRARSASRATRYVAAIGTRMPLTNNEIHHLAASPIFHLHKHTVLSLFFNDYCIMNLYW
jgi:hypothetical protein